MICLTTYFVHLIFEQIKKASKELIKACKNRNIAEVERIIHLADVNAQDDVSVNFVNSQLRRYFHVERRHRVDVGLCQRIQ